MRRPGTWTLLALAAFVIALGAFAIDQVPKYLTTKRTVRVATPVPTALFNLGLLSLPPHAQACLLDVSIPSNVQRATFTSTAFGKPGPPLSVTMSGPGGYSTSAQVAGGWGDGTVHLERVQIVKIGRRQHAAGRTAMSPPIVCPKPRI